MKTTLSSFQIFLANLPPFKKKKCGNQIAKFTLRTGVCDVHLKFHIVKILKFLWKFDFFKHN